MLLRGPLCFVALFALTHRVTGDLLSDIESALENATDCASCHALLVPLQKLAHMGNGAFVNTMVSVCQDLEVSSLPFFRPYLPNL